MAASLHPRVQQLQQQAATKESPLAPVAPLAKRREEERPGLRLIFCSNTMIMMCIMYNCSKYIRTTSRTEYRLYY